MSENTRKSVCIVSSNTPGVPALAFEDMLTAVAFMNKEVNSVIPDINSLDHKAQTVVLLDFDTRQPVGTMTMTAPITGPDEYNFVDVMFGGGENYDENISFGENINNALAEAEAELSESLKK